MAVELLVYADESGIHSDAPYCVVSGWIASPRQWKLFEESWTRTLQAYSVSEFHAHDFFGRRAKPSGHYCDWSGDKAKVFIDELMSAINQHRLYPIGGAVDSSFSPGWYYYNFNTSNNYAIMQQYIWYISGGSYVTLDVAYSLFYTGIGSP